MYMGTTKEFGLLLTIDRNRTVRLKVYSPGTQDCCAAERGTVGRPADTEARGRWRQSHQMSTSEVTHYFFYQLHL